MKRLLLLAALTVPAAVEADGRVRDSDVGVPPGSPLDWRHTFRQPVPSGRSRRVAEKVSTTDGRANPRGASTQVAPPPPPGRNDLLPDTSLYDMFNVLTLDLQKHLPPLAWFARKGDRPGAQEYPPDAPPELCWMALISYLRNDLHPEVVSAPETVACCVEMGIPARLAAQSSESDLAKAILAQIPALPAKLPAPIPAATPHDTMLTRMVAQELTSGFAFSFDPEFAWRTLELGDDVVSILIECSRSPHSLLAENATAILANMEHPDALREIRAIAANSKDLVCKFRAISGLVRRGDSSVLPVLQTLAKDKEEFIQCYAFHSMGILGDPAAMPILRKAVEEGSIRDRKGLEHLWSVLPAVARIGDRDPETLKVLTKLEATFPPKVRNNRGVMGDGVGTKMRIVHQMTLLALAASGDAKAEGDLLRLCEGAGGKPEAIQQSLWYVLAEVLSRLKGKGEGLARKLVESDVEEPLRVHALRALFRDGKGPADLLKAISASSDSMSLRAEALRLTASLDRTACIADCRSIVAAYASGSGAAKGPTTYLVMAAARIGGRIGAWNGDFPEMGRAAVRALTAGEFGRLEGGVDPDLNCRLSVHPPVVEMLIAETPRAAGPGGIQSLLAVVPSTRPQVRSAAVLALGGMEGKEAADTLGAALNDADGWLRYCAYLSLVRLSGQDHFADWIFGDAAARKPFVERYRAWFAGKFGKK